MNGYEFSKSLLFHNLFEFTPAQFQQEFSEKFPTRSKYFNENCVAENV